MNGRYHVGEWLVEPEQSRLVRGSETAKLDRKAIQVLSFLASHLETTIGSTWTRCETTLAPSMSGTSVDSSCGERNLSRYTG
jgi:hypothetical protein